MKKNRLLLIVLACMIVMAFSFTGCGSSGSDDGSSSGLANGTYVATFTTDSGMFHVNEANNNKGILTVEDGQMTIHVSLAGKGVLFLYPGLAEEAQQDGAVLLEPTTDKVVYSDGMEEEVYGFDIPVPALDEEFDVALVGKKGKWYDHKVMVSNPVEGDDIHAGAEMNLENGEYTVDLAMEGGSGKASVESPTKLFVENGEATLTVTWSSPNYDYMLVDGEKYLPVNEEGNSVFEIPVKVLNEPFTVVGDTTAMSQPHEVEYKFTVTVQE